MFLTGKSRYVGTELRSRGSFLFLFLREGHDGLTVDMRREDKSLWDLRAAVKSIELRPVGNFMMGGVVEFPGFKVSASGCYGHDGQPRTIDPSDIIWDRLVQVPADIVRVMMNSTSGHNDAGDEGEMMREWGLANEKALRAGVRRRK